MNTSYLKHDPVFKIKICFETIVENELEWNVSDSSSIETHWNIADWVYNEGKGGLIK